MGCSLEDKDRARIGIYYLLEWIRKKAIFTVDELRIYAHDKSIITISKEWLIIDSVMDNLLYILVKNEYLVEDSSHYRLSWNQKNPKPPRAIVPPASSIRSNPPIQNDVVADSLEVQDIDTSISSHNPRDDLSDNDIFNVLLKFTEADMQALCKELNRFYEDLAGPTLRQKKHQLHDQYRKREFERNDYMRAIYNCRPDLMDT